MYQRVKFVSILLAAMFVGCSDDNGSGNSKASTDAGFELAQDSQERPSNPGETPAPSNGNQGPATCQDVTVSDLLLNVDTIELFGNGSRQASPATGLSEFSLVNDQLFITPTANMRLQQVRLVLDENDNVVVGADANEYPLKTPSQQQSGLKILVPGKAQLQANQTYLVDFEVDLDKQVVDAGKKCLLKPVLKATSVAPANPCAPCFACLNAGGTAEECAPLCGPNCL